MHGPDAGWAVPLTSEITVGRQGASLALADPGLNFHHCTVRPHGQRWQIRDERSHGGTRVLSAPRTDRGRQRLTARIERQLSLATRQRRSQTAALRRATGPGKRIGHRWQRLEIGDQLILGATRLQVRRGPAQSPTGPLRSLPND